MNIIPTKLLAFLLLILFCYACGNKSKEENLTRENVYTNPVKKRGGEPWAIFHNGMYYYTEGHEDRIVIMKTTDITNLAEAERKVVWLPKDKKRAYHLWGPEIHYINNKWYVYFAADDGNTDNHQIYVIENSSDDPFEGEFEMKAHIPTDKDHNWAIHASIFELGNKLYMIWSGWQTRRVGAETQCIYIAEMENPWSLKSDRVLLSKPEFEWERQWVNPDGTRTAYPIYVNESPQAFHSKDKDKIIIYYSASGNWTPYYSLGMLTANANSDLLDASSWSKQREPVFTQNKDNGVYAPGSVSLIPSPDGTETYLLYHARQVTNESPGALDSRAPRLQKIDWDEEGMPVLGVPVKIDQKLPKPSGIIDKQ